MNVLFVLKITGLPGIFSRARGTRAVARPEPLAEPLAPMPTPVLVIETAPPPASYTTTDSNEIYCAAVKLAGALHRFHKEDTGNGALGDTSMRLYESGITFGREHGIPSEAIVAAFDGIGQELQEDAPPMSADLADLLWAKMAARPTAPYESSPDITTVSTTDKAVRVQRGNAEYYEIDMDRIPSPLALCWWAGHLGTFPWVTGKTIRAFVAAVTAAKGWPLSETAPA